ncbi:MAG: hypothetical protein NVV68_02975 [Dokdonella sp.]|nr:hypothetical protein [Dokdonella sp.]
MSDTFIAVYADWDGLDAPLRLGRLEARRSGARELFEFAFDTAALTHRDLAGLQLDPRLGAYSGPQYPPQGQQTFGMFADASPDRWGRLLMGRRLEREQRAGRADPKTRLFESDYLLGVHDDYRVGALRLRRDDQGLSSTTGTMPPHPRSSNCVRWRRRAWRWSATRTIPRPKPTTGCAC